ncbi:MAG: cytochrome P460 family protein [Labilithrix sp.]|nr:cytochrome P460 family protein [Labilithrix sp.]
MPSFSWLVPCSALCALGLLACGDDQAPEDASALLSRIRSENYRGWARAPGYETRRPSDAPHSDAVDIYVNSVVSAALAEGTPRAEWPVGSIIVKDGWDGGDLELIAVMEKRSDGWFWAEYFDDESKYSGRPSICTGCHESGSDYVLAFALPK